MKNKNEQLSFFGKVIDFPKKNQYEKLQKEKKLEVAEQILWLIADSGYDFSIVIEKEVAEKFFYNKDGKEIPELLAIGTSLELNRKIKKYSSNIGYSIITGNELDEKGD